MAVIYGQMRHKGFVKPLQNMRASRANELAAKLPAHVCASIMGHDIAVAAKHYLRVMDTDYENALKLSVESRDVAQAVTQESSKS